MVEYILDQKTHELGHVKYKDYHLSATAAGQKRVKILNKLFNKKENKKYKSISPKLNAGDVVIFHSFIFMEQNLIEAIKFVGFILLDIILLRQRHI